MKLLLIAGFTLLSFNVFACPKLSGDYSSWTRGNDAVVLSIASDTKVDQKTKKKTTTYKITNVHARKNAKTQTWVADGRDKTTGKYQSKTTCSGNRLVNQVSYFIGKAKRGKVYSGTTTFFRTGPTLVRHTSYRVSKKGKLLKQNDKYAVFDRVN